ncbi:hypothetical protein [Micromonospora sp. NPDC093277]|uniref:hypothetical protein n=1 Tax=Micromonospora sp. NPDC093277 TaxID=3364291 RepID=UPI0038134775
MGALLMPLKFILLLVVIGREDYIGFAQPDGVLLVLGIELFLYLVPTVAILGLLAAIGRAADPGIAFRALCVMLLGGVAGLAILITLSPAYLSVEVAGQAVVAGVAVSSASALRRRAA